MEGGGSAHAESWITVKSVPDQQANYSHTNPEFPLQKSFVSMPKGRGSGMWGDGYRAWVVDESQIEFCSTPTPLNRARNKVS
jgi:hypothetical protein